MSHKWWVCVSVQQPAFVQCGVHAVLRVRKELQPLSTHDTHTAAGLPTNTDMAEHHIVNEECIGAMMCFNTERR